MSKKGYHHGNLRSALVDAALALIERQGPQGLSLSDAARSVGVTPAAVYRHFAGRDDLIAECARQGFDLFAEEMRRAWNDGRPNPLRAFEAVALAYLDFARDHPGHYMAMFESGISLSLNPDLARAHERALAVFARAAEPLIERLPDDRRPPAAMFAAHVWALSHGIVELFARPGPGSRAPFPPDALLEAGIGIYLRGLGLVPGDPD